ncbi:hypothetical protein F2Q69_00027781 [Brassica cretica]|uniref:Uncharacterized protein n=1 Tax=Brassica cretica TaxID=69181 RepID=A0A8S9RVN1_BRACR|nr:hypothetical protein F2Q69_00027781 [Brassica cretica]
MPVLMKSGQSASQEEAVEEMKDCRSITQHWCQSTVIPERGPSIFQDRLKPRSHTKYMSISTRSSKEELLFFSDPARLERSIRKEKRTSSIDTTSTTSIDTTSTTSIDTISTTLIDTTSTTSIDTCDRAMIDSSTRTWIDTNTRADMRIDGKGTAILEPSAATEDAKVPLQRSLADLTRPSQFYTNRCPYHDARCPGFSDCRSCEEARSSGQRKAVESERHQVNAISDDDFGEVLEQEKLEEDAFLVESFMSIGSSYWCQRTSTAEHRSTSSAEHRSTPLLGLDKTV